MANIVNNISRCISFAEFGPNTFTKQLVVIGLDDGLALRVIQAIV